MARTQLDRLAEVRNLIAGAWRDGERVEVLADKHTGLPVTRLHHASVGQVGEAVGAVVAGQQRIEWNARARHDALTRAAGLAAERAEELAELMVRDTGFTITDSRGDVARTVETLHLSARAALSLAGEMVPIDTAPGVADRMGFTVRMPIGVVAAITPFNAPVNTVAHKVAPALAAGNGVVLKPAEAAPGSTNALVEVLLEAGVPPELLAVVHGPGETVGAALTSDERIGFITFTGSTAVGRRIQAAAGLRKTQLELGSIASTIVCADADLDRAASRIVPGSFRKSGQVCTSIQRLYVHRSVVDDLTSRLVADLATRQVGDPRDPRTLVGPMISEAAARRVAGWIDEAVDSGARVLCGGERTGALLPPTILTDLAPDATLLCQEVFGPVLCIIPFDTLDEAFGGANSTEYGLAAGIFTADISTAFAAARALRFGGVHINETSSSRLDVMPFGGVKASGHGQEGPLYAAREMTEERLVTVSY